MMRQDFEATVRALIPEDDQWRMRDMIVELMIDAYESAARLAWWRGRTFLPHCSGCKNAPNKERNTLPDMCLDCSRFYHDQYKACE